MFVVFEHVRSKNGGNTVTSETSPPHTDHSLSPPLTLCTIRSSPVPLASKAVSMKAIASAVKYNNKVITLIREEPGLRDLANVAALGKIFVLMDEDGSGDVDFREFYNFFSSNRIKDAFEEVNVEVDVIGTLPDGQLPVAPPQIDANLKPLGEAPVARNAIARKMTSDAMHNEASYDVHHIHASNEAVRHHVEDQHI